MVKKHKKKFIPRRAKHPPPDLSNAPHNARLQVDAENPERFTLHEAFQVDVIGYTGEHGNVIRSGAANLKRGDHLWFVLPYGPPDIYRGIIGPRGNVVGVAPVLSGQTNLVAQLRRFGRVTPVKTYKGEVGTTRSRSTAPSSSASTKLSDDLPTDEGGLRALLDSAKVANDKSAQRKLRAQLRKVNPNWAKSK